MGIFKSKKPIKPTLPDASSVTDPVIRKILAATKQMLDQWGGNAGDKLDSVVTYRDLIEQGLVKVGKGAIGELPPLFPPGGENPARPMGPLTDLVGQGAMEHVLLDWKGVNQEGYAFTEVWRSASDDLGTAVLRGRTQPALFADKVAEGGSLYEEFYYWVRAVNGAGKAGPFNAVAGLRIRTGYDPDVVLEAITGQPWKASSAYYDFQIVAPTTPLKIEGVNAHFQVTTAGVSGAAEPSWASVTAIGGTIADGAVTWTAVESGKSPFVIGIINGKPMVFISGAAIKEATIESAAVKSLAADKLFAVNATVFELLANAATIHTIKVGNNIQSADYSAANKTGWIIDGGGNIIAYSGTFHGDIRSANAYVRGDIEATSLKVDNANIVKTLHLQGQAVTIPVSAYSAAGVYNGDSTWNTVHSASITSSGAPIAVKCSARLYTGSTGSGNATVQVRLVRGSTVLWGPTTVAILESGGGEVVLMISDTPGAGSFTYQLQMGPSYYTEHRCMLLLETKR